MVQWQQTLVPSVIFYSLATVVAFGVAFMIAGLANALHYLESRKKGAAK